MEDRRSTRVTSVAKEERIMSEYDEWIIAYLARTPHVYGQCTSAAREMHEAFPELVEVRGWANYREHVWLIDSSGAIVDPTATQFVPPIEYRAFQPGDTVRVGRCMNCGDVIYAEVERLDDSKYARSVCDNDCAAELEASLDLHGYLQQFEKA
jgi:hypothetical protein